MTDTAIGLGGIVALFALFILRMPVGLSMLTAGFLGTVAIRGWTHALPSLSSETFAIASFYQLTVIPMFVLMGNIAGASGMGRDLYNAAYAWVGHIRGGLASATIIACAFFASLCGSAAASAITMGRVALPEMKRFKYDDALATGTVASGGTMGFIFPPSAGLVIYGLLTEQAIGRLFLAGVIPGIILTVLFLITIQIVTWRRPGVLGGSRGRFWRLEPGELRLAGGVRRAGGHRRSGEEDVRSMDSFRRNGGRRNRRRSALDLVRNPVSRRYIRIHGIDEQSAASPASGWPPAVPAGPDISFR